ncbi:unnamed protein product [Mytilus edulis]|uniref:C-type lectin domain-containing protein n=1 Tax=Mytilus edulis TaxID=6550 RepID=A0A8S3QKN4_MYTED|nr:unnamed protein product [Mytilus edulis]
MKTKCMPWNESRTACFNDGMDLAVISDYDVLREVQGYLRSINYYRYKPEIWIGLKWSEVCSSFFWVNKQQLAWPDEQQPWALGEPNCHREICENEATTHNCVRLSHKSLSEWKWRTHDCNQCHYAICQNSTGNVLTTSALLTPNCNSTFNSVNSTTIDSPTTTNSVTTSLTTKINSTATSSPTSIESTVVETSPESTETQSQTQLTTESAKTKLATSSTLISTMESTELPITVTTEFITINRESSFNASTENMTNGTLLNNCAKKCRCKSLSNEMNAPKENYRIDKRQTSAYIRRHSSAYDGRLSSRIIGYKRSSCYLYCCTCCYFI